MTEWTLNAVYEALYLNRVVLEGSVLKPSMVISGKGCPQQARRGGSGGAHGAGAEAHGAGRGCRHRVPVRRPERRACHRAPERDEQAVAGRLPWPLSFSYGRALQQPSLKAWKGAAANVAAGQAALLHRSRMNGLACAGRYSADLERQALAA